MNTLHHKVQKAFPSYSNYYVSVVIILGLFFIGGCTNLTSQTTMTPLQTSHTISTTKPTTPPLLTPISTVFPPSSQTELELVLDISATGTAISPNLYGLQFEEVNHMGDGGIYAELVQNRSFNESDSSPSPWSLITSEGSTGSISLDFSQPLNALNRALKLQIDKVNPGGRVGLSNLGYWGIKLVNGTIYTVSFFAKGSSGFSGPITISLESTNGEELAEATISDISEEWQKYTTTLKVVNLKGTTTENQIVISSTKPGTVWLQVVSLFPPTWKDRPNGLRIDLMQMLLDLKPTMCRFPGGDNIEGKEINDFYNWKKTIGDLSQRPGRKGIWDYHASDGLGFHELLQMCEDLGATPVYVAFGGYSHWNNEVIPKEKLQSYIDDALDAIEYANGDVTTYWGGLRAANGHPESFNLEYIEISNEDSITEAGIQSYQEYRFPMFFDQIKAKYPNIHVISTMPVTSRQADLQDDHMYRTNLIDAKNEFVHGSSPRIMIGEWSELDWNNLPKGSDDPSNLNIALHAAAFMTDFEIFSDSIWGASYSPLMVNYNDAYFNSGWIYLDAMSSFGTPSYYAQVMFVNHVGDKSVPASITGGENNLHIAASRKLDSNTVFLKVVNINNSPKLVNIKLENAGSLDSIGSAIVLTADNPSELNRFDQPNKVIPIEFSLQGFAPEFSYSFPANSITILTLNNVIQEGQSISESNKPIPALLKGHWKFDEGSGNLVADDSGNGNTGTLMSDTSWSNGIIGPFSASFKGISDSFMIINKPVVDTSQSFSVSAWVKMNALDNFQTAVCIEGNHVCEFYLQWRLDTGKFALSVTNNDKNSPDAEFVSAKSGPETGVWYHLVGISDGTSLKLYVNGELQESKPFHPSWRANGPTIIGRAKYNDAEDDFFNGQIDDVRLYSGVLTDQEISVLANSQSN
jgi:alpha-N-arabinofuranosidase